jgi:enoyl-CoA hydratase
VTTSPARTDRWKALDFGPPSDAEEPDLHVLVEYTQDERVAIITLNRPHADNAITTAMGARLTEILETIAVRLSVRAVILTGAGQRAFSVGSDLRQRKDMTKQDWLRQRQDFDRTLYTVRQLRKPIFTAVNGIAYGGGCELAQSTDFIIASNNATFGQPEAMLGLAAGGGSPALLPRLLPPGKAMQMLMTGDPISAQEAHRLGMVNEIYAQDELLDAAHRIAAKIASNSPTAVQAVKQAVRMGQGEPIEQARVYVRRACAAFPAGGSSGGLVTCWKLRIRAIPQAPQKRQHANAHPHGGGEGCPRDRPAPRPSATRRPAALAFPCQVAARCPPRVPGPPR